MRQSLPLLQRTARLLSQNAALSTPSITFRPTLFSRQFATAFSRPSPGSAAFRSTARPSSLQQLRQLLFSGPRNPRNSKYRLFSFTRQRCSQQTADVAEPTSLSARLRKLSREYGWSAFGVYMALTALDFPFCFLAVRWLGTERIGAWEHAAVEWAKRAIPINWDQFRRTDESTSEGDVEAARMAPTGFDHNQKGDPGEQLMYDHGVQEAEKEVMKDNASIWTQLALAYAIHKTFIFIRVPATVAVTPKVVKTLRGWGWNIGKRTPKAERELRKADRAAKKAAEALEKQK